MSSRTEFLFNPRIVKNGGAITGDTYKSYYSNGATTEDWKAGDLLTLRTDGCVTLCTDSSGIGTGGTKVFAIALEDHDSSAFGKSVFVNIQEINSDTVLVGQLCASSSGSTVPVQAMIGDKYDIVRSSGILGVDVDDTTNPLALVTNVEPNFDPFNTKNDEDYGLVEFKILASFLANA